MSFFSSWGEYFGRFGSLGLFSLAFTEASFNPVPVEVLFIPFVLSNPELAWWYVLLVSVGSALGALLGYYFGYLGKVALLHRFFSEKKIQKVHHLFEKYDSWAVFVGGFTPLPFKLISLASGVFSLDLKKFFLVALLSRFLRFSLEAVFLVVFGDAILSFFTGLVGVLSLVLTLVAFLIYLFTRKYLGKKKLFFH